LFLRLILENLRFTAKYTLWLIGLIVAAQRT
jgi:hypothetical protein